MTHRRRAITAPVEVDRPGQRRRPGARPAVGRDRLERPDEPDVVRDVGVPEAVRLPRTKAEKLMMDVHTKGQGGRVERDAREGRVRRGAAARARAVGDDAAGPMSAVARGGADRTRRDGDVRASACARANATSCARCPDQLRSSCENEDPTSDPRWPGCSPPRTRTTPLRNLEFERDRGRRAASQRLAAVAADGGRPSTPSASPRTRSSSWLGVLNDLRLVLGTRLEVTEETTEEDFATDDPRAQSLRVVRVPHLAGRRDRELAERPLVRVAGLAERGRSDRRPDDLQHVRGGPAGRGRGRHHDRVARCREPERLKSLVHQRDHLVGVGRLPRRAAASLPTARRSPGGHLRRG